MERSGPSRVLHQHGVDLCVVLAVGVLGVGQLLWAGRPAFVDDAYISIANAQTLLSGRSPSYPDSSALTGATCAPHVVLLALLLPLFSPEWAAWAASLLGAMVFALGATHLALALRLSKAQAMLLGLGALFIANTPYQLLNGLETSWAMAGVVWTLAAVASDTPSRDRLAAFLCGLLPALRPELLALSAPLAGYLGVRAWRRTPNERPMLRTGFELAACALLGIAPWLVLYWALTGSMLPETIAAKRAYFAEGCNAAAWKLRLIRPTATRVLIEWGPWLAALTLLVLRPLGLLGLAFMGVFFAAYYRDFPGALGHYFLRYLYVLSPLLLLGLGFGLAHASRHVQRLSAGLLGVSLLYSGLRLPDALDVVRGVANFTKKELYPLADALATHLPPGTTLLLHDAGYVSYATELRSVDLVGLKTPRNVHWHRELTLPTCGRARPEAIHRIALESGAQYFVVLRKWDEIFGLTQSLLQYGWWLRPMWRHDDGYDVYALRPPAPSLGAPLSGLPR
jgi:hypothetical protein